MANIQNLRNIVNDPTTTPENLRMAQDLLQQEEERLAAIGGARVQAAVGATDAESELAATLDAMRALLQSRGGAANVSISDIRRAVNDELAIRKINIADLSPDLLQFLNSKRAVSFTLKMLSITTTTKSSGEFLSRPLTQKLLSDVFARNNSYLYGGAGTGKTYVAEQLGKLLGWTVITLNCNQYTSPLDILGGQTVEGYQEGKLIMAWSNKVVRPDKTSYPINGAILLLDELPKIDPNTAGILNDALAKVKSFDMDAQGNIVKPTIRNGRNEVFELENMYVIATGNVPLNTIDPDYEANFKQDLSLQDRFIGSTYEIFVDYQTEFDLMEGFAFIWLYLVKVREKIKELRATGQAFVSMRLMINVRETYKVYREITNAAKTLKKGAVSGDAVTLPKTIIESLDNFFVLFKDVQRESIKRDTKYDEFKKVVLEKNKMPYVSAKPNFDTPDEITECEALIKKNKAEIKKRYS